MLLRINWPRLPHYQFSGSNVLHCSEFSILVQFRTKETVKENTGADIQTICLLSHFVVVLYNHCMYLLADLFYSVQYIRRGKILLFLIQCFRVMTIRTDRRTECWHSKNWYFLWFPACIWRVQMSLLRLHLKWKMNWIKSRQCNRLPKMIEITVGRITEITRDILFELICAVCLVGPSALWNSV